VSIAEVIRFPCEALPEDPAAARLLGVYPQRQDGFFMQRVKLPGGRIEASQLCALASIAERCAPAQPLHLTTRQGIELHGLRREDIPAAQRDIEAAGLTALGACGDTLRNCPACPGAGSCSGTRGLSALCDAINARAGSLPWIRQLPRKIMISLPGSDKACARPWINDVGLVVQADGAIQAVVAGSLGARPGTGILFDGTLSAASVLPFVIAALRLFHAEGDRTHRSRARLRHVRERMGDAAFLQKLNHLFKEELRGDHRPEPDLSPGNADSKLLYHLRPPLGDLAPDPARELAGAVAAVGAKLRIGFEHDLLVHGEAPPALTPPLQKLTSEPCIVSCPGTTWCSRAIADSRGTAASIRATLPADCALGVSISGCPNNCSQAAVADIGLIGRIKTIHNVRTDCFRLLLGGGQGKTPALAQEVHEAVPAARVPAIVKCIAEEYQKSNARAESFSEFVTRHRDSLHRQLDCLADLCELGEHVEPQGVGGAVAAAHT